MHGNVARTNFNVRVNQVIGTNIEEYSHILAGLFSTLFLSSKNYRNGPLTFARYLSKNTLNLYNIMTIRTNRDAFVDFFLDCRRVQS